MLLVNLPFLVFFGILVRPGTDLGQGFEDKHIFFVFFLLFLSLFLICYFM